MASYITRLLGRLQEVIPIIQSTGVSDANKIAQTDASGKFDISLFPVGLGQDVKVANAGENLSAGAFVYINGSGEVVNANASTSGQEAQGYVLDAFTTGNPATVYFEQINNSLSGLTTGTRYYLSDSVSGAVTATPVTGTGKVHQYLGRAISATEIAVNITEGIILA